MSNLFILIISIVCLILNSILIIFDLIFSNKCNCDNCYFKQYYKYDGLLDK